jgi:hypothetical protein
VTHPVLPSHFELETRGADVQRQHAQRLLLSGFDVQSAAVMTGLPISEVQAIADGLVDEFAAAP